MTAENRLGETLRNSWRLLAAWGIATVILGLVLLVWPGRTLIVLARLAGLLMLVGGIARILWVAREPHLPRRAPIVAAGVLGVAAGMFIVVNPFATILAVAVLIGLFWVVSGIVDVIASLANREHPRRALLGAAGAVTALGGAVILAFPRTIAAVAVVAGIVLIALGLIRLMIAWQVRTLGIELTAAAPSAVASARLVRMAETAPLLSERPVAAEDAPAPPSRVAMAPTGAPATAAAASPDDLKRIEGIGPKIEVLLRDGGIHTYVDLSTSSTQSIQEILAAAGSRYQMHDPSTWPEQAGLAADERWDDLDALKSDLDGGRR